MISESVDNLLSTCVTAIINAIGAIVMIRNGIIRLVMPTNVRMVYPSEVIRSISRSACVTQITAVRLMSTTKNTPNVVRKTYLPMDPIRSAILRCGKLPVSARSFSAEA